MGVSGAGKTTLGRLLAERLGMPFIEGDEYHPPANVAKMASGVPLEDEDRWPRLGALNRRLGRTRCGRRLLGAQGRLSDAAACRHRRCAPRPPARRQGAHCARQSERQHRYMPASLLESQLAILEPSREAIVVDIAA
jgi:gluconokinase